MGLRCLFIISFTSKTAMDAVQDNSDIAFALSALFAVIVVPSIVHVRVVYTFLWMIFAGIAIRMQSPVALGIATALGLSVMLSWYMLRFFDRSVFDSVMLGWFGRLSQFRGFCWLMNAGDFLCHFVGPLALAANYLKYVEVWMALPVVGFSVLWVYFVADGSLIANHVYHFSPPRPVQFWAVASATMLVGNLTVPLGCVLAQRSGVPDLLIRGIRDALALVMSYGS